MPGPAPCFPSDEGPPGSGSSLTCSRGTRSVSILGTRPRPRASGPSLLGACESARSGRELGQQPRTQVDMTVIMTLTVMVVMVATDGIKTTIKVVATAVAASLAWTEPRPASGPRRAFSQGAVIKVKQLGMHLRQLKAPSPPYG